MITLLQCVYYFAAALCIVLPVIGVAVGQSIIAQHAMRALYIQPRAKNQILRSCLLSTALTETSAVLSLIISLILILAHKNTYNLNPATSLPALGIAFAIAIAGLVVGIASSYPAKEACLAIARQPFFSNKINNFILLTMSFIQTPIIFGFIISLFIFFQTHELLDYTNGCRLLAAGMAIGLGGIGPALGLGRFAQVAVHAVGYNKKAYNKLASFTFISQALIETPIIFTLITALVLATTASSADGSLKIIAYLASAISIGVGTFAPAYASAQAASGAGIQIAQNLPMSGYVSKVSMLSQAFIDSSAIYCWLISLLIILFG